MPAMSNFATRLHDAIRRKGTPALVGIDPRFELLPPDIVDSVRKAGLTDASLACWAFVEFSRRLIDVVAPLVPAVKPQAAFFEQYGPAGVAALGDVVAYARQAGLIVILDAKRGDIGSTAEAYAEAWIGGENPDHPWQADALTVNPYLGADTLEPFVKRAEAVGGGIYVLVRTSNPGAGTFQDVAQDGRTVFEIVAETVERLAASTADADGYGCVGAVVGATYPDELKALRTAMPHAPLLVPGYGSQGGTAADIAAALDENGLGAVINSSRAINFAYRDKQYAGEFGPDRWEAAAEAATRKMIADLADVRPV